MALQPLAPLAPLSQHIYHPALLSTGSGGGTGGEGSGAPPDTGTGGLGTYGGPPGCQFTEQGCGGGGGLGDPRCPPGEVMDSNGFCVAPAGQTASGGQYAGSAGGCSLFNPGSWTTSCILRVVLLILGLILIAGGVWMLKPALVEKPLKAVTKAAAIAA